MYHEDIFYPFLPIFSTFDGKMVSVVENADCFHDCYVCFGARLYLSYRKFIVENVCLININPNTEGVPAPHLTEGGGVNAVLMAQMSCQITASLLSADNQLATSLLNACNKLLSAI